MVPALSTTLLPGTLVLTKPDPSELFANPEIHRPSEWFARHFPQQVQIYGPALIESHENTPVGKKITALAMNIDCMAAVLGGDKRMQHQVVYFEPDLTFYFYDPRDYIFKPTTEEKLGNQLRALLMKCALEIPEQVDKCALCTEFRSDKQVKAIVHRAKSILAADESFFSIQSHNERLKGPETTERIAKRFVQQLLEAKPNEILTITRAYNTFNEFLKLRGLDPVKRPIFKGILVPVIREEFKLGLRNDLLGENHRQQSGWKGLRSLNVDSSSARN